MQLSPVTLFVIGLAGPFVMLSIMETIVKPLLVALTKHSIKAYLKPAWERLDQRLALPGQWEQFTARKADWIFDTVLDESTSQLTEDQQQQIVKLLIKEFDLATFLDKSR